MAEPEIVEMESETTEKVELAQKEDKDHDYLTPMVVRRHLRLLWKNEEGVLREVFGALNVKMDDTSDSCPTDVFFLEVLPVVPSRFRPVSDCVVCVQRNWLCKNYVMENCIKSYTDKFK